ILPPPLLLAPPCFARRRGRFSLPPPPPRTPPRPPPFPLRLAANFGPFNRGGSRGEGKPPAPRSSGNQASGDGESRRHSAPPRLPPAKAPPPVTPALLPCRAGKPRAASFLSPRPRGSRSAPWAAPMRLPLRARRLPRGEAAPSALP